MRRMNGSEYSANRANPCSNHDQSLLVGKNACAAAALRLAETGPQVEQGQLFE